MSVYSDLEKIKQIKKDIYNTMISKGLEIPNSLTFESYPKEINKLPALPISHHSSYTLFGECELQGNIVTKFQETSDYATQSCISLDCPFPENVTNFEFLMKFNNGNTTLTPFFCTDRSESKDKYGINFGLTYNSLLSLSLSSNGSSYDIADNKIMDFSAYELKQYEDLYVRLTFDGSNYLAAFSKDKVNYQTVIDVESNLPVFSTGVNMTIGANNFSGSPYDLKVDLSETYLKINDQIYWKAKLD